MFHVAPTQLTIRPTNNYILCVFERDEVTKGGIIVPQTSDRVTRLAPFRVLAVGGKDSEVARGDRLLIEPAFAAKVSTREPCTVNGERFAAGTAFAFLRPDGVVAVVEGEDHAVGISDIESDTGMVA